MIIAVNFPNWKIHCDDHCSLSSITAVQNELFHLFHIVCFCCFFSTSRVDHSNTRLSSQLDRSPGNWTVVFSILAALSCNTFIFILFLIIRRLSSGRGTAIYELYGFVPLYRVWFSSSILWDRLCKSESLGLE